MNAKTPKQFPRKFLSTAIGLALTGASFSAFPAPTYVITDLGTLGGAGSIGYGINATGEVTGQADITGNSAHHAFLYSNGQMQDLGTLGGTNSTGGGINDSRQVSGRADTAVSEQAFLYSGGQMQALGALGSNSSTSWDSLGYTVNNAGHATGQTDIADGSSHAFLFSNGVMQDIGTLGGNYSNGFAINASDQITGWSYIPAGTIRHAFLYNNSNGQMQDLGVFGGTGATAESIGNGINATGQVAGNATDANGLWNAFLYSNGQLQNLGTLGGANSYGYGVNNSGQVAGAADVPSGAGTHGYLYTGGQVRDLSGLLNGASSGWVLTSANAINDNAQLAGVGTNPQGQSHAFLATPTGTLNLTTPSGTVNWDDPANWEMGFVPNKFLDTVIAPQVGSVVVNGPTGAPVTVNSLVIGGASGASGGTATLNLNSQPLTATNGVSVLSGGTLALGGGETLGNASTLTVAGGTFDIGGNSNTVAGIQLQFGTIAGTAGTLTSTSDYDLQSGTVSANLGGAVGLVKGVNDLAVTLSGINTYTGQTTINLGALELSGLGSIAASSGVVVNGSGSLDIVSTTSGASIRSLAGDGFVSLGDQRLTITNAANGNFSGTISDFADGGGVTLLGGNQTFSGSNDYTGLTDVQGGTLTLAGVQQALLDTGAVAVGATGTLILAPGHDETIGSLGGVVGGRVTLNGNTLTTGGNGTSTEFAGEISGNGLLLKEGTGTLTLSGANTWTGLQSGPFQLAASVTGGVLSLAGGSAIDDRGAVVLATGIGPAPTLNLVNSETIGSLSGDEGSRVTLNANTLTTGGDNTDGAFAGVISGSGGLVKQGTGTFFLSGASAYTGLTTISGGTLALAGPGSIAASSGVVDNGTFDISATAGGASIGTLSGSGVVNLGAQALTLTNAAGDAFAGAIAGTGGLTLAGGTEILSGTNTYTGLTDIQVGILTLAGGAAIVDTGAVNVGATGRLDLAASETIGSLAGVSGSQVTLQTHTLTVGDTTNTDFGGAITGIGNLVKQGTGTFTLSGANIFLGVADVRAGTLTLNGGAAIADTTGSVNVAAGATLNLNADETVARLDSAGTIDGVGRTLTAATYDFTGGTVNANLGGGILTTTAGTTALNGTAGAATVNVTGGTLALGAAERLADTAALTVNGVLGLGANDETVGSLALGGGTINGTGTLTAATYASTGGAVNANLGTGTLTTTAGTTALNGTAGAATVNVTGGTLALGAAERLADTAALTVNGGTFELGSFSDTVGSATLVSGTIQNGSLVSGSPLAVQSGTLANLTVGALVKTTPGTATLSGTDAGQADVQAGVLTLNGGNTGAFNVAAGATLNLGADETVARLDSVGTIDGAGRTLTALSGYNFTGGTVNANLGGGALNATAGTTTLNGSVGAGTVNVNGGTLTLNGTVASATVNVNSGTLALGADERLSDAAVLNLNGGIFDLNGFNETVSMVNLNGGAIQEGANLHGSLTSTGGYVVRSGIIDTVLAGPGGLTKIGSGLTATLTQFNTYTGLTTIREGTLALAGPGGIANSSGVVVETDGTFDIAETTAGASIQTLSGGGRVNLGAQTLTLTNAAGTFAGGIEGEGGLILASGKETLSGANAFTGQTTVKPGASLILAGAGSLAGGLGNQGTVNVIGPGSHVIGGDVVNDGRFKITDASVRYDGEFINNGAYISDPSTNQFNDLSVGANGYLAGGPDDKFIVTGNFNNASTQSTLWDTSQSSLVFSSPDANAGIQSTANPSPGARSTATASQPGQHTMELAGVDKGPTAKGAENNFAWGSVTLDSGNRLALKDGNSTPGAALYTSRFILPGGVGELGSISSDYNVYYDPTLPENQYLAGSKRFGSGVGQLLPWTLEPFSGSVIEPLTPNQQSFAEAVNEACTAPRGIMVTRCLQLQGLSQPQQRQAIASLTPDQIQGQVASPILFGVTRSDATATRLAAFHSGGVAAPLSFNFNGVQIPMGRLARALGLDAKGGAAGADGEPFRDSPLGVYVQARFDFGDLRNTAWARGFNSQSRAVTVGADYRLTDQLVSGLAFNYTNTVADYVNSAGRMESDTYMGSFYGSYFLPKDFYVDWLASYGGTDYSYNRRFSYPGFNGQTNSKPVGEQFGFAVTGGKEFSWQGWTFNPFLRWEYLNLHVDAYQEKGGQGFDVSTGGQTNHSFASNLGVQVSHAVSVPWGVLVPSIRVDWEHQYLNDNRAIQMRLSEAAPGLGNFVIRTGPPDRDYVNLGGSVSATLPNGGAGFVRYQTRLGQAAITDHIVEAGVRISF